MRENIISEAFTCMVKRTTSAKLAGHVGDLMSIVFVFEEDGGRLERFSLADESHEVCYTSGAIRFGRKSAFDPRLVEFATAGGTRHVLRLEDDLDLGLKRSVTPFYGNTP